MDPEVRQKSGQRFRIFPNEIVVGLSGMRCQKFVDWSAQGSTGSPFSL